MRRKAQKSRTVIRRNAIVILAHAVAHGLPVYSLVVLIWLHVACFGRAVTWTASMSSPTCIVSTVWIADLAGIRLSHTPVARTPAYATSFGTLGTRLSEAVQNTQKCRQLCAGTSCLS